MTHVPFPPDPGRPVPRALVDPIIRSDDALAVIALAVTQPLIDETIVLVLDDGCRGSIITAVSGTHDPDDVLGVVDTFSAALEGGEQRGLVLASVRPGVPVRNDDVLRWSTMLRLADQRHISIHGWFVIDDDGATGLHRLVDPSPPP